MGKNILLNDPASDVQSKIREIRLRHTRMSQILDQWLTERPNISSLIDKGIIVDSNDPFVEKANAALQHVQGMRLEENEKQDFLRIVKELLSQHNTTVQEMNSKHIEKMKEHERLHNEAHEEARKREIKLRAEIEHRSKLLAHNQAAIEKSNKENKELQQETANEIKKMKEDYEEQIRILQESTRIPITTSVLSLQNMTDGFNQYYQGHFQTLQQLQQAVVRLQDATCVNLINNALQQTSQLSVAHVNQLENQKKELTDAFQTQMNSRKEMHDEEFVKLQEHFDNVLYAKTIEIEKLKQQKKEMSQVVEKKLQGLRHSHEKEIEKERNIIAMLQQNLKEQKEAFMRQLVERNAKENKAEGNSTQIAQLMAQVQSLTQVNRQTLSENEKLKKLKGQLEQQIVCLTIPLICKKKFVLPSSYFILRPRFSNSTAQIVRCECCQMLTCENIAYVHMLHSIFFLYNLFVSSQNFQKSIQPILPEVPLLKIVKFVRSVFVLNESIDKCWN
ncbi:viral A-type inclusion protein [Reticulomyxa filosa]|uniref:Viral A-type inclusion protein n=1 Tax=Reticulomyxa filosa TaxID=46433 RepID=X6NES3_RETFI|nr:viral A-type inclusion protein [Reticulomyxa filosa]|eukprot:ETO23837.1 viral A-type inclusion protein [Reticulomyxa filosa]